jgi:hypothetical protein
MIIAIDPGKSGAFAAMRNDGTIVGTWPIPYIGSGIDAAGVAEVYRSIEKLMDFDDAAYVYIERIFTKPSDGVSMEQLNSLAGLSKAVGEYIDACDGGFASQDHLDALKAGYKLNIGFDPSKVRLDGRVGNLNYAKGAGVLEMCALWGWPITTVSPRTWMKVIKDGVPGNLMPKEQSIWCAKALWPEMFAKDHEFSFLPGRKTKPDDGMIEACLIAEFGRRKMFSSELKAS